MSTLRPPPGAKEYVTEEDANNVMGKELPNGFAPGQARTPRPALPPCFDCFDARGAPHRLLELLILALFCEVLVVLLFSCSTRDTTVASAVLDGSMTSSVGGGGDPKFACKVVVSPVSCQW